MTEASGKNPYRPGVGVRPLYLAGREAPLRRFGAMLRAAPEQQANMRVTGLRGVDKTVLIDAVRHDCEMAIVLTSDTDLVEPIRIARDDLGLHLALLSPSDNPARSLRDTVNVVKKVRHGSLRASQLPDLLRDARGDIHRPRAWRAT
jgi:hypothetical protein